MNRLSAWFDRLMKADQRYGCGVCDDRFLHQAMGVEHILRCHPEFSSVAVYESRPDLSPTRELVPIRTSLRPELALG